jgi:hypothetical protein
VVVREQPCGAAHGACRPWARGGRARDPAQLIDEQQRQKQQQQQQRQQQQQQQQQRGWSS